MKKGNPFYYLYRWLVVKNRENWFYFLCKKVVNEIKILKFKEKWRKLNPHNFTFPETIFPVERVSVGEKTYGPLKVCGFMHSDSGLRIGNYCSIAADVEFWIGGEHSTQYITTYPVDVNDNLEYTSKGDIIVKDDVWIGSGVKILSGVELGQGCIIGSGSIVTKNIPPYAVYAGGRIIRYRFKQEIVKKLMNIDFNKLCIENCEEICKLPITDENIDKIVNMLSN